MVRFATHCFLLLTIVGSQLFSGVSCCCLARTVAGIVTSIETDNAAELQAQPARCSKCIAHQPQTSAHGQTRTKLSRLSHSLPLQIVSERNQCTCVKTQVLAASSSQQHTLTIGTSNWCYAIVSALTERPCSSYASLDERSLLHIPSSSSWQALACIWRN